MEIKHLWQILWKRKWIFILVFTLVTGATAVATLLLPSVYESTGIILVEPSPAESYLAVTLGLKQSTDTSTATADNVYKIATSETIVNAVISRLHLTNRRGELLTADKLLKYRFLVSAVRPRPYLNADIVDDQADLIEFTAESTDPETAAKIVNTVIDELIENNVLQKKGELQRSKQLLQQQITDLQNRYLASKKEVRDYNIRNNILDLQTETEKAVSVLSDLMDDKKTVMIDISTAKARLKRLKEQLNRQDDTSLSSDTIENNSVIKELKSSIMDLDLELTGALAQKNPDHPDIIILKLKLNQLNKDLQRELELFKDSSGTLEAMERELAASETKLADLDRIIAGTIEKFSKIPEKEYGSSKLEAVYTVDSRIYNSMVQYLYELDILEKAVTPDIKCISGASVSDADSPKKPKKVLNAVMGIFIGLMLAGGAVFLNDAWDDTISNRQEVLSHGLNVLGEVPVLKRKNRRLLSDTAVTAPEFEAHRKIRNRLKTLTPSATKVMITSAVPGEGKTTFTANLGIAMASCGETVLIMDLDLRISRLHRLFGMSNDTGLTDLLENDLPWEDVTRQTPYEGLSIITGGPRHSNPAKLLESSRLAALIPELAARFDRILMTVPPLLPVDDAAVIGTMADGCITVIQSRRRTHEMLVREQELMTSADLALLGAVINQCRKTRNLSAHYG